MFFKPNRHIPSNILGYEAHFIFVPLYFYVNIAFFRLFSKSSYYGFIKKGIGILVGLTIHYIKSCFHKLEIFEIRLEIDSQLVSKLDAVSYRGRVKGLV